MKLKTIIGIALIIASFCGMVVWESFGRVRLTTEEVLVASRDIEQGQSLSAEDFAAARVEKGSVLPGSLKPQDAALATGLVARYPLAAGQQVLASGIGPDERLAEGQSFFVLDSDWISSRSSLTEVGDDCDIYLMPDEKLLGKHKAVLVGENVEIICTTEEFFRIHDELRAAEGSTLLLVIDGPGWRQAHEEYN